MNTPQEMLQYLNGYLEVCQELLQAAEEESLALRNSEKPALAGFCERKKNLLPRFNQSLDGMRKHRAHWQGLSLEERARWPEVGMLLRKNQDLTMKIIVLDRENEQALLRRGLVPPRQLPPANRQRPHFVADLYRRQGVA